NFAFSPQTLSIQIGDKVVWTNTASDFHRVVWDNGTFSSSEDLDIFQTYEVLLTTSGTFPYHCGIHSFMTGSITVNPAS
ncbi:MAG: plastocyanin, partial [candidate division Zixibacteria bacterium]|nr:plastocyanin [candidate division Zixibacteria bacterium]